MLPTARSTAWVVTQYGLVTLRMPLPGQPGRASQHLVRGTSIGPSRNTASGVWVGLLDGRVVAQVTDSYGFDSHLVIAGKPDRRLGGSPQHQGAPVASTGGSPLCWLFAR